MEYGICTQTLIPVRREPSEASEMTTQILFGETFSVLEKTAKWAFIQLDLDQYKGWIDLKLVTFLNEEEKSKISAGKPKTVDKILCTARVEGREGLFYILAGSDIHFLDGTKFQLAGASYELAYPFNKNENINIAQIATSQALQMLNIPYLWGGRTTFGIDCSGLIQTSYKIAGINLIRDASQQVTQGATVNFLHEAQTGDLVFFDNDEGRIVHVGILLSNEKVIHASGSVRVDTIDHQGIFNQSLEKYTHKLRLIKRMV